MNTFTTTIGKNPVSVNDDLKGFELFKKASSNVDYFGIHRMAKIFFIQFNNGKCFVYRDVLSTVLQEATTAESIGKFFHANIRGKYDEQALPDRCIRPDDEEDESEGNDQYDPFENNYDEGFDSLDR